MGGSSLLIGIGTLLSFCDADDRTPRYEGEACHYPMDECQNNTACGILRYCKEDYEDCQPSSSVDHTYLYYDYIMRPNSMGICYLLGAINDTCDDIQKGCFSMYCNGDTKSCEFFCLDDSLCYEDIPVCLNIEECDENYAHCGSSSGTINYIPSNGSPGLCYAEVGLGEACDATVIACATGLSCGNRGVCEITCLNDGDCKSNEFCVYDVMYCDDENDCTLSDEADPNFAWIFYDTSGIGSGGRGVCKNKGLITDSCDDKTQACTNGLVCRDDACITLCSEKDPCLNTEGVELICISRFNYCDENYQACSYDLPTDPNASYSILYEKPSSTGYGTCYELIDASDYSKKDCTQLSHVCADLHCNNAGLCQAVCDEIRLCEGTDETCLAYLEYCSDFQYKVCHKEEDELCDYMKYTEFRHTDEKEGLCYSVMSSYTRYCGVDHVCEDSRYCDQSIMDGCDDTYQMRCNNDVNCDPFMTCLVMEECDDKYKDCGGIGVTGTIHYIKYDPDNVDHSSR